MYNIPPLSTVSTHSQDQRRQSREKTSTAAANTHYEEMNIGVPESTAKGGADGLEANFGKSLAPQLQASEMRSYSLKPRPSLKDSNKGGCTEDGRVTAANTTEEQRHYIFSLTTEDMGKNSSQMLWSFSSIQNSPI